MLDDSVKQLWQYVEHWAEKTPDEEAVIYQNERLDFKHNL